MIKEVIVVEGKDDLAAVKKACQAEVITTNGLGLSVETIALIKEAQGRCGVIVLTDPDYPGEKIRRIIDASVPGCRHAFIEADGRRGKGKGKPFGVEDAPPAEIQAALRAAHYTERTGEALFGLEDLLLNRLVGDERAQKRRTEMGKVLGIGKTNAKQFLKRLNAFGISRVEFTKAIASLGSD